MVLELKLRKVGNSVGVVLPKDAMARLNVKDLAPDRDVLIFQSALAAQGRGEGREDRCRDLRTVIVEEASVEKEATGPRI